MLSKKTKYAIKALVVLGKHVGQPPMQISKIAEEERKQQLVDESLAEAAKARDAAAAALARTDARLKRVEIELRAAHDAARIAARMTSLTAPAFSRAAA